jgi:hypothetical protein
MGFRRLQEKIEAQRKGEWVEPELRPDTYGFKRPEIGRLQDADRDPSVGRDQLGRVVNMGYGGEAVRAGAFGEEE